MKKMLITLFFLTMFFVMPTFALADDAIVVGDFVTVRKTASSSGKSLGKIIYGSSVNITGESGSFYKLIYDGKNTGYMDKKYVKRITELTYNDAGYCNSLKGIGFPDSYCPYLSYLHKLHPAWTFTPMITNLDFYKNVVDGEEGKNYIQSTNDAYRSSSTQREAGGWYTANQQVVAYMLDPRNFLTEKTIFMFENLGYSPTQTKAMVTSILGESSYLNGKDTNGTYYTDYYVNAGSTYGISPLHLAARTKQEGGADSTYGAITGNYTANKYDGKSLVGFYNYYNIGAYADKKTSNPMVRGLAYAAGYVGSSATSYQRPWKTRKGAIYGGAEFLAKSYISKGQNTLYLEKFNTNPNSSNALYTNQYMTNIFAPYEEGCNMKNSYEKNGVLNQAFNFVIPVYKNMPARTYQPSVLSGDNALSGIYMNNGLIAGFDSDIVNYTLYVIDTTKSVNITANVRNSSATIAGTGTINLTNTTTTVPIKVTASNGNVKTYNINIVKVKDTTTPKDVVNKLSVKSSGNSIYGISSNTAVSTITSSVTKISPSATVTITDSSGKVKTNTTLVTGDKIVIKTLTSNAVTYNIAVNGDLNGDGKVDIKDLLKVQKHILGSRKVSGITSTAADTNFDGKVNVQDLLRIQKNILGSLKL